MGDRFDCFGDYFPQDLLCKDHCALRLRCAVERQREMDYDRFEAMVLPDVCVKAE